MNATQGVRIRGPTTVQCDACGQAKANRVIDRAPRDVGNTPGARFAIDFHDYEEGYNGLVASSIIVDRHTGLL